MTILPPTAPAQSPTSGLGDRWKRLDPRIKVGSISLLAVAVTTAGVVGIASHAKAQERERNQALISGVMTTCLQEFTAAHGQFPEDAIYGSNASTQLQVFNDQLDWQIASYSVLDCAQANPGVECETPGGSPLIGQEAYCYRVSEPDVKGYWLAVRAGQWAVEALDDLAG